MRTHAEWNVDTHILRATGPTSAPTRVFISWAALLVNVMARISNGEMPSFWMRWAMRDVSTRVLPDPAPATTSRGPSTWVTASRWTGLSPSSRSEAGRSGGIGGPAYRRPRSPPGGASVAGGVWHGPGRWKNGGTSRKGPGRGEHM